MAPKTKAWRAKPAMPYRPPGRTCALRARTARLLRRLLAVEGLSLRACTVSFVSFVISKTLWQSCVR